MEGLAEDRARALQLTPVSPETEARLDAYVALLLQWQARMNLVAASTLPVVWTRHIADSLQLLQHAGEAQTFIDLGSGAGFPGLVLACALADQPLARIELVESDTRKAAFLREAARVLHLPASVHAVRIEQFACKVSEGSVVTARALAPLSRLLRLASPLLAQGAQGLFPKGAGAEAELADAARDWTIDAELLPSVTESKARIIRVRSAVPKRGA